MGESTSQLIGAAISIILAIMMISLIPLIKHTDFNINIAVTVKALINITISIVISATECILYRIFLLGSRKTQ